ncbi:MAG: hypothetical protein ACREBI_12130 [Nitrosotalea sp.]
MIRKRKTRKKTKLGSPHKNPSARGRTPNHHGTRQSADATTFEMIDQLRKKLDLGAITLPQFRRLIHLEDLRNEWATRIQLRSIARDLLPHAAGQARHGKTRMLAVVSNILLRTEVSELKQRADQDALDTTQGQAKATAMMNEFFPNMPRPDRENASKTAAR